MLTFQALDGTRMRPFPSVEAMDEHIIARWNDVVRPSDHVIHLGDVAWTRAGLARVRQLHGRKWLIPGNHDRFDAKDYFDVGFEKLWGSHKANGWLLTHFPVHESSLDQYKGNVHGHIHERPSPTGPYINVSVEAVNYTPVSLEVLRVPLTECR
jgi:calcineurin-like phosphoesterase family protein